MKRNFFQKHAYNIFIALLCVSVPNSYGATETWHGTSVSDVIDENLIIKGHVHLPSGGTTIEAKKQDVVVKLENDPEVKPSSNGSRLYLVASAGKKITIDIK